MKALDHLPELTLDQLRARRSAKWVAYPPDVLPAWVAEMDFPLAAPIAAVLHEAINRGDTGYPRENGIAEAFAGFARSYFGWTVDPARTFLVVDVMIGIAHAIRVFSERGERIAINSPVYPPFFHVVRTAERVVHDVPLVAGDDGWRIDLDRLEAAFAGGVRVYLLCSPHNPVGRAFRHDELEAVAALAARYDVAVISDEIHAPLVLPGAGHVPFSSVAEAHGVENVILTSASKAWNVAGLKAAVLISASPRITRMPFELRYGSGHLGVLAAVAAFRDGVPWLRDVVALLDRNRGALADLLAQQLPAIRYRIPEAGYLAWLDCRALGLGDDPAAAFLQRGRVALSAGPDFGPDGAGFARLNFATYPSILEEIVARMRRAVG